jgi:hypothetical protein
VTELLQAVEDEAASAVADAYAEGYKAGRVEAASLWKPRYDEAVVRADRAWKTARASGLFALLGGIAVGFGAALAACAVAR